MGKLTLHVDDDLIRAAKEEASSRRTSVSKLVSDYFRVFCVRRPTRSAQTALPPITASLLGCIRESEPGAADPMQDYVDYLDDKHA